MTDLERQESQTTTIDGDSTPDRGAPETIPDGADAPASDSTGHRRSMLREIIETALLALIIFFLVRTVVLNFKVDGTSMMPTFEDGEMLLVNRNAYRELDTWDFIDWIPGVDERQGFTIVDFGEPERGDVVVFTPLPPGEDKPYIKRVIGVPGDQVEVRDEGVFINGTRLEEDYVSTDRNRCDADWEYCGDVTVTVPEGSVYVMGDNRGNSEDSRVFGVVPDGNIIGKAWVVYWPDDAWGPVDNDPYER